MNDLRIQSDLLLLICKIKRIVKDVDHPRKLKINKKTNTKADRRKSKFDKVKDDVEITFIKSGKNRNVSIR